jgi:lactam utilization protein B
MIKHSSNLRELQQYREYIQYRIGWLDALLKEAELKLLAISPEGELLQKDLDDYPLVGNILDFLKETNELSQLDKNLYMVAASDTEQLQSLQERIWNNIAWIQKMLAFSQLELKQVTQLLENWNLDGSNAIL